MSDLEGDSLSYRYRYWFDSVWVDADVEYVGSVGDRVVVLCHSQPHYLSQHPHLPPQL